MMITLPPLLYIGLNLILITLIPQHAHSFCVYNQGEPGVLLTAEQIGGVDNTPMIRRFKQKKFMHPGDNICCPYDYKDCSDVPDKNHPITLWLHFPNYHDTDPTGYDITGVAGGYIIVSGPVVQPKFEVFNADHQSITFNLTQTLRTLGAYDT
ncbi:hypothetical protein BDA99DRAFT_558897 [Phascolomyces articulosus]|uniref:MD-2-related lipid-recognition domain-containing protein n=1 Tax=Phascolomyces articulosus TaxID=60185 RepID=A0AAD5KD67_9FUNG|nr:hypothetical protein BDA99DRAFT_558897 [Phascolomyces articulosus]